MNLFWRSFDLGPGSDLHFCLVHQINIEECSSRTELSHNEFNLKENNAKYIKNSIFS